MLTARLDVSGVPPQGGYVAKQCPVRPQWDVLVPAEPLPVSDAMQRRFDLGNRFEDEVFAELVALHPEAIVVERDGPEGRARREQQTVAAMRAGAPLIIGGRLPLDDAGRRVGEPDLLVHAEGGGYQPIDVKAHGTLAEPANGRDPLAAHIAPLASPGWQAAIADEARVARKTKVDLLQLAHYRRMLEACGHAAVENRGAIIGTEEVATWYDLDAPLWRTPSRTEGTKVRSTMEIYDFEFGFRLDIIETARRHIEDPSVEPLVVPVRIGECASCPWWAHCHELLEEAGDVSLLPRFGWNLWRRHRDRGVCTIADLASLDVHTAHLHDRGIDLANLFAGLATSEPYTPIAEVIGARKVSQIDKLADAGIHVAADAAGLDERIGAYSGSGVHGLAAQIDLARARLGASPAYRVRGSGPVEVPRADVEVDLDLESTEDGVYLWGALVSDRTGSDLVEEGYRAFAAWAPMEAGGPDEVRAFEDLWAWLDELRTTVHAAGRTLRVYCYNDRVEAGELRRLAASEHARIDAVDTVEELVTSDEWVDLLRFSQAHLITGGSLGLKHLAPLGGFAWEDEDPGGEQSMSWHDLAVGHADPAVRAANRDRILTYNRNDVEATLALREWLAAEGAAIPRIEDLDAVHGW